MAFTEKGSLKRHVQSRHDNFRPYVCRECGKACTRRFLLRKHHLRHHPGIEFDPVVIKEEDQTSAGMDDNSAGFGDSFHGVMDPEECLDGRGEEDDCDDGIAVDNDF